MERVRAVGLLSGGLDSTLAAKLMVEQGIEVLALAFTSPFYQCSRRGICEISRVARTLGIPLKMIDIGPELLRVVRKPKYGYGSGVNPCIDCRILMLRKAKQYAKEAGAKFIFTGEVLGQRPMSQNRQAFGIIEMESGLRGKILRPLSAQLLQPTEAEFRGWVDRGKLLSIRGRSRKLQMAMAKSLSIDDYSSPAGGCLLTDKEFAAKMRDVFAHCRRMLLMDILLLKVGRHFRLGKNKMIVGRDEVENKILMSFADGHPTYLEAQDFGSPITMLEGRPTIAALSVAAKLTARYCDAKDPVLVTYRRGKRSGNLTVMKMCDKEVQRLRIGRV